MAWERLCKLSLKLFQMGLKCAFRNASIWGCSRYFDVLPGISATDTMFHTSLLQQTPLPRLGELGSLKSGPYWGPLLTEFCWIGFCQLICEVAGWGLLRAWKAVFCRLGIILEILKQVSLSFLWHLNLI